VVSELAHSDWQVLIDLWLAGAIGYGLYFHFSGRVWCRFTGPHARVAGTFAHRQTAQKIHQPIAARMKISNNTERLLRSCSVKRMLPAHAICRADTSSESGALT
jgi:hypothetical protein